MLIAFLIILIAALSLNLFYTLRAVKGLKSKYSKVLSQKKSSEVVTGHIAEQLAPFLDNFPYDPKQVKFLGQPIDYIHYGDDQITFIEVKSGKSRLSKKQKHIKQLIENNQVFWDEVRIHGKN
jgi:predicted Holliday junction resolvase-like endonuclease